jgi:heat shock protein 5
LIGRKFNEKEVQNDIKHFPFTVVNKNGQPRVKVDVHNEETTFTPEEISAMVLGKVSTPTHTIVQSRADKRTDEGSC